MIHIHIGGAGIKIGDMLWRLYNIEQADMDCKESIYQETQKGYIPRAIFTDTDDEMLTQSFIDKNYITEIGNLGSACTCSFTIFGEGRKLEERLLDKIRKLAEGCDKVNEFIITSSISGGTGSGFTMMLSHPLDFDYGKASKQLFCIFPSPQMNNNVVYTYNATFAFQSITDFTAQVLFDNQGMYKMLDANVDLDMIDYTHLNNLVSQTISAYTSIPRFNKKSNSEIFNTIIPYRLLSILTPSHCPLVFTNDYKRQPYTFHQLQKQIFSSDSQLLYNVSKANYISSSLISRGLNQDIFLKQKNKLNSKIHKYGQGTNLFISNSKNYQVIDELVPLPLTNTLFVNDGSIVIRLRQLVDQFYQLNSKRAFEHIFRSEGFDTRDIGLGAERLEGLIKTYEEVMQENQSNPGEETSYQSSESDEI